MQSPPSVNLVNTFNLIYLNAHHRSRWRKYQWRAKGWLVKKHSFAKQVLDEHNIPYESAFEFVKEPKPVISFDYAHVFNPPQLRKDVNHPDFKPVPCFSFGDSNVLLEGLDQAKLLTNTVEVNDDLPEKILKLKEENPVADAVHKIVQKNLYSALVYDGAQEKLPIRKDPERPAYRFPRDYGITDFRKNMLVSNKLLQLCESISPLDISTRAVLNNARFQLTIEKDEDLVQFALRGDKVLMADSSLPSFLDNHQSASAIDLPNLYPLKPTISMEKNHFYKRDDFFPVQCIGFHCSNTSRRDVLKVKEKRSWENSVLDPCEEHDPCKHGGICISTDSGPICECRNLEFEGIYCEKVCSYKELLVVQLV
ncbi:uncharacterized protein LOC103508338 [Diaphorina citri]|uniref:Uncharacterized protein LOC103508338 n=1 Tax=Diaphorina citri TaxID=121845 RepID=A0A1S3CZP7_DIACI|nr:uncharacterized protein LOC103508338 [Diaphorina citri]